jgi:hypothetical protein
VELVLHDLLHLVALVLPQQTVIHKDARQLIAHGALQQRGGNGAVHAAGQCQQHAPAADLAAINSIIALGDTDGKLEGLRHRYANLDITSWSRENRVQMG